MKDIIVYHGGTEIVEHPICKFGRRNLDFGQGFYITNIRKQAVDWAIVAGVDRIVDMGRTVMSITGDASCAVVMNNKFKGQK